MITGKEAFIVVSFLSALGIGGVSTLAQNGHVEVASSPLNATSPCIAPRIRFRFVDESGKPLRPAPREATVIGLLGGALKVMRYRREPGRTAMDCIAEFDKFDARAVNASYPTRMPAFMLEPDGDGIRARMIYAPDR